MSADVQAEVAVVAQEVVEVPKDLRERAADKALATFRVETLCERVNLVKEAMRRCMKQGQHFGTVPGTRKPSLWKPGAELLGVLFQLGQRYRLEERLLAHDHVLYTVTCVLFFRPTGAEISEGIGACSSMEYKYRCQTEPRAYENGRVVPAKYTPHEFYNTCLKMACKRALVAATINASGVSEVFTQDTEDNPDLYREQDPPPVGKPQPDGNGPAAPTLPVDWKPGRREEITGYVVRAWPNDYQGKRYYFAKFADGRQLQATDPAIGEPLLKTVCGTLKALVEHSPKPGKYYLVAFAREQTPALTAAVEAPKPASAAVPPPEPQKPGLPGSGEGRENPAAGEITRRKAPKAKHEAAKNPTA